VRHVRRGGTYFRVADPSWAEPLSGALAKVHGGRWNAPRAFDVVYLSAAVAPSRALVRSRLEDRGIQPEDVLAEAGPVLIRTTVPEDKYVDAVSEPGLRSLGLPGSYPLDARGSVVEHAACQPIGRLAWDAGEPGIACRSAVRGAAADGEELAYFARRSLRAEETIRFVDWVH
jgi:RES domain